MTAEYPASRRAGSAPAPVAPSRFVQTVIRPMTKVLNPLIVRLAGRRHFGMAAQIQHVGRRSGKVYLTPTTAHVHGDVIVIALTFGNQSDWVRNVQTAGGGTVRINGRSYRATNPQFLRGEQAAPWSRPRSAPSSEPACACSASASSCAWTPPPSRVLLSRILTEEPFSGTHNQETAMAPTDPWPGQDDDTDCGYYDTPSGNIWCPDDEPGPWQQNSALPAAARTPGRGALLRWV